MKKLTAKLNKSRIQAISWLTLVTYCKEKIPMSLETDSTFEKSTDKEYILNETIGFDELKYIFNIELLDFGWEFDGELLRVVNDSGEEIHFEIASINYEECTVYLKGRVFGDLLQLSNDYPVVELSFYSLSNEEYEDLDVYQSLILEAFKLEVKKDFKLSLFTYFTAIEALVSNHLGFYKRKIHDELHYSLEHLELDKKVKLIVKEATGFSNLRCISVWSSFSQLFKDMKEIRNNIAHANDVRVITQEDVSRTFFCLIVLNSVLNREGDTFDDIRNCIFPSGNYLKKLKKRLK